MDFTDSPREAAFRQEVRSWLQANYPVDAAFNSLTQVERAKLWQKRKYDAGWACITWPKEHGGRDASAIEQVIWEQEEARIGASESLFGIGHGMCAPTLMAWASDEQCRRYLPKLASGEEIWCQLFSEPTAGSDLAAVRSQAVRDGADWVVNGQKVWTTFAHISDYAVLLVRTDSQAPKHRGLSYFFIDMKSPGVEVRPIRQISGTSDFNEVYFTDVRVPDSQRLGEVGQGWQVALTTLMNERASVADSVVTECGFDEVFELARTVTLNGLPAINNSAVRSRLADWYCQEVGLRFIGYRALTALSKGATPGPENSIAKLVGAPKQQDMAAFALDLLNNDVSEVARLFQRVYMTSPGLRIAGGTDEILTNIVAERVLGMPQEIRTDKGIPFSDIPT